ncbi:hypothetical protein P8452_67206 [Trifolium repens]|nr:hypothetical protein P8452_67206 [Trifolium repens]
MVKIHKFVYAFVIFLSLIVLVSGYRFKFCRTDNECPTIMCNPPDISKCVRKTCYCMQQKPKKRVKK